jgi:hypothetical protein
LNIGSSSGAGFIGFLFNYTGTVSNARLSWSGSLTSAAVAALLSGFSQLTLLQLNPLPPHNIIGSTPVIIQNLPSSSSTPSAADLMNAAITCSLPGRGIFSFIYTQPNAMTSFGTGLYLMPNVTQTFEFKAPDGQATELLLRMRSNVMFLFSCARSPDHSAKALVPNKPLHVFYSFSLTPLPSVSSDMAVMMPPIVYEAQLVYPYQDQELRTAGISDPMTLQWYRYIPEQNKWDIVSKSSVDKQSKTVTQITNQLSDWTISGGVPITGAPSSPPPSPTLNRNAASPISFSSLMSVLLLAAVLVL